MRAKRRRTTGLSEGIATGHRLRIRIRADMGKVRDKEDLEKWRRCCATRGKAGQAALCFEGRRLVRISLSRQRVVQGHILIEILHSTQREDLIPDIPAFKLCINIYSIAFSIKALKMNLIFTECLIALLCCSKTIHANCSI